MRALIVLLSVPLLISACAPSPLYVAKRDPNMPGNIPRDVRGRPVLSEIVPTAPVVRGTAAVAPASAGTAPQAAGAVAAPTLSYVAPPPLEPRRAEPKAVAVKAGPGEVPRDARGRPVFAKIVPVIPEGEPRIAAAGRP